MPKPFRSVLAVLVGYLVLVAIVVICTVAASGLFHLKPGHPTVPYLVVNVVYSVVASLAGGWLVAYIAGYKPKVHGCVLALIVLGFSVRSLLYPAAGHTMAYQTLVAVLMPLAVMAGAASEKER